jgi:methylglyoxal/glyoxal reductase
MVLSLASTLALSSGVSIPRLGLGVFRSTPGVETVTAVRAALELGYRHIDTARIYANERDVGEAIRSSEVPRSEVFVTSKLWNTDQGYENAIRSCRESLRLLGLAHLDLYLLHWPVEGLRNDSWRALVTLREDGLCRTIGVSNFMIRHIRELAGRVGVVPEVNQIEMSPFLQQRQLRAFCDEHRIVVEAYSPLTKGRRLEHPVVRHIAMQHGKTPAQVLIRWCLEKNVVALPKSSRREHLKENTEVFDFALTAADLQALDALEEDLHTGWDPSPVP